MTRTVLAGRAGSPGLGSGRLLVVTESAPSIPATTGSGPGRDDAMAPLEERRRLLDALRSAADNLGSLATQTSARAGDEVGAIFEAQAMFAQDPGIVDPALAFIDAGATADAAILRATDEQAAVLAAVDDPYFRERAADVRDVGRRVAAILRGEHRRDLWHPDGAPAIVVAVDLDPSAVATLRPELVAGIALGGGAPTGHAAIVARALGIPMVLGLGPAIDGLPEEAPAAVDGTAGELLIEPDADDLARVAAARSAGLVASTQPVPGGSGAAMVGTEATHGVRILANVASALESETAARAGADGIGLVRTELLFLGRTVPPSIAEQRATYAAIRAPMGDRPVVFRTLDIGGDKPAAWQPGGPEANPALGVRGLRLGLRHPELLDAQLEALLTAAAGGELHVMLPMVSAVEELAAARTRLAAVAARLARDGIPAADLERVRLGVMIEVPSAALMADAFAEIADFFSIGTNDLVQYTMAADRTNPGLIDLASALQPAVLRLIDGVVRAADRAGRHVAVCGESAADPRVMPLLVGLGVRELSVGPAAVAGVRAAVAALDPTLWRSIATEALAAPSLAAVEALLER